MEDSSKSVAEIFGDIELSLSRFLLRFLDRPEDVQDVMTANEPKYYAVDADSGRQLKRGFCPECGSHVLVQPGFPDIIFIVASSLDHPSGFKPLQEIWTSSAQPWDMLDRNLRQFDQQFTPEDLQQLVRH